LTQEQRARSSALGGSGTTSPRHRSALGRAHMHRWASASPPAARGRRRLPLLPSSSLRRASRTAPSARPDARRPKTRPGMLVTLARVRIVPADQLAGGFADLAGDSPGLIAFSRNRLERHLVVARCQLGAGARIGTGARSPNARQESSAPRRSGVSRPARPRRAAGQPILALEGHREDGQGADAGVAEGGDPVADDIGGPHSDTRSISASGRAAAAAARRPSGVGRRASK
jgi:hypothetical protein